MVLSRFVYTLRLRTLHTRRIPTTSSYWNYYTFQIMLHGREKNVGSFGFDIWYSLCLVFIMVTVHHNSHLQIQFFLICLRIQSKFKLKANKTIAHRVNIKWKRERGTNLATCHGIGRYGKEGDSKR